MCFEQLMCSTVTVQHHSSTVIQTPKSAISDAESMMNYASCLDI